MTITCPKCQTRIADSTKLATGPIYTSKRVHVRGVIDDHDARVYIPSYSSGTLNAYFELQGSTYRIVECLECRNEFVCLRWGGPVWPLSTATVAEGIPPTIAKMLREAKLAHAVEAETAALLAARTATIRTLREQGASSFDDLVSHGKLTRLLSDQANEIRLWANVTGHEDVPEDTPSSADVEELLGYLEALFDVLYVQPANLQKIRDKRQGLA